MFSFLETKLMALAHEIPLELFVVVASFVEEVIAPIPSPTVMVTSGVLAFAQGYGIWGLLFLGVLGAVGKMFGGVLVYTIADKAEDITTGKLGRYFGITQGQIEALGARVGTGFRGLVTLTVLRALPFIPSVLVSVGGGVLKVPLGSFMISTFLGTIIRDAFYLYAGYAGVHLLGAFISHSGSLETLIEIGVVVLVLAFLGYRLYKRRTTASHQ